MKRYIHLLPVILSFLAHWGILFPFSFSYAQCDSIGWSTDPSVNLQVSTWGQNPHACTDGEGGVYILWNANTQLTSQYMQYVDRCGFIQWPSIVEIKGEKNGSSYFPSLSEDGFGGALVSYTEWEVAGPYPQDSRVRVNRVDREGNLLWGPVGVRATSKETDQFGVTQAVPDGQGGAFVSFGILPDSLFLQHLSSTGQRLWGDEGILVTGESGLNFDHILISDQQGGAIIQWFGYDTGFRRFDSQGNLLWHLPNPGPQWMYYSRMKPDGDGGAVLGGRTPSGIRDIVANRISPEGAFLWGANGLIIEDSLGVYSTVTDIALRTDSILVVYWMNIVNLQNNFQALVQLVTPDGELFFPYGSIPPSIVPSSTRVAAGAVLSDNNSTVFLFVNQTAAYAQKLNSNGEILWDSSDVVFSYVSRQYVSNVSDKNGGLINIGSDEPLNGIFAHQISKNGNLGEVLDSTVAIEENEDALRPKTFKLYQNYPNPFNLSTSIVFKLSVMANIKLKIYNSLGQEIKILSAGRFLPATYEVVWDGTNNSGKPVPSGLYYYRLTANRHTETKKMLLIQ